MVLTAFNANSAWALDFKTAYEAALQHDAAILAERAAAQAAQERLPQALSQRRPSLSLSAGQNRNHLESQTANILGQRSVSERYYDSNNAALQLRQPPLSTRYIGADKTGPGTGAGCRCGARCQ